MDKLITDSLSRLELGEPQQFKNMGVLPLFASVEHSLEYLTLKEALAKELLTVKEVDKSGSVPELKAVNRAEIPVLLLDGEELTGAKQNRGLNTSLLLKELSETIIPVSCTEEGRWSYVTEYLSDSGVVAPPAARSVQHRTVSGSLERSGEFETGQVAVWHGVRRMHAQMRLHSRTGAVRDAFEFKKDELNEYLKAFDCMPHQKGLLAFMNGEVAGFDIVSLKAAYQTVHAKLVKSYALGALLQKKEKGDGASVNKARAFLEETVGCEEKIYEVIRPEKCWSTDGVRASECRSVRPHPDTRGYIRYGARGESGSQEERARNS